MPTETLKRNMKSNNNEKIHAASLPGKELSFAEGDEDVLYTGLDTEEKEQAHHYDQSGTPPSPSTLLTPGATVTRNGARHGTRFCPDTVISISSSSGSPTKQLVVLQRDLDIVRQLKEAINRKDLLTVRGLLLDSQPGYLSQECIKLAKSLIKEPKINSRREQILYLLLEAAYPKNITEPGNLSKQKVIPENLKTLEFFKESDVCTTNIEGDPQDIMQQNGYAYDFLRYLDASPIIYLITNAPKNGIQKPNERHYEDQNYRLDIYLQKLLGELTKDSPGDSGGHRDGSNDNRCDVSHGMFLLYAAQEDKVHFFRQCLLKPRGREQGVELPQDTEERAEKLKTLVFKPIDIEVLYLLKHHTEKSRNEYLQYIEDTKIAAQKDILKNINNPSKLMKVVACAAALREMLHYLNEGGNDFEEHSKALNDSHEKVLSLCKNMPGSKFAEYCRIFFLIIMPLFVLPAITMAVVLFTPGIPHLVFLAVMYSKPFEYFCSITSAAAAICGLGTTYAIRNGTFAHAFAKNTSLFFNAKKPKENDPTTMGEKVLGNIVDRFSRV